MNRDYKIDQNYLGPELMTFVPYDLAAELARYVVSCEGQLS